MIGVSLVCGMLVSCEPADYIGFVPSGKLEVKCPGVEEKIKLDEVMVDTVRKWFQDNQDGWQIAHETFATSYALYGADFILIVLKDGAVLKRGVRQHAKQVSGASLLFELCA